MLHTFLLISFLWSGIACGNTHVIRDARGLIELSRNVSNNMRYKGETVLLDSDIDFTKELSEEFVPIGKSWSCSFAGTFDGQGHVIRGFALNSSLEFAGLFSFVRETEIRNVVIGESCSVESTSNSTTENTYVGSVIGYCTGVSEVSLIENCVNMGSITFTGNTSKSAAIGGIVGSYYSESFGVTIKNCANYGSIASYGSCHSTHLGGIAGEVNIENDEDSFVQSCLNYGTITFDGTADNLYLGGLVGSVHGTTFENCMTTGKITSMYSKGRVGNVIGIIGTNKTAAATHCHWTNATGYDNVNGDRDAEANATSSYAIELNATALADLNEYAADNGFGRWHILHLNGGLVGGVRVDSVIAAEGCFPEVVSEGSTLVNWCTNLECSKIFDPETNNVVDLYAQWEPNKYLLTFVFGNGTKTMEMVICYGNIEYPRNARREGYTFDGWDTDLLYMPARNITITAKWAPNNYTVTLEPNGGNELSLNEIVVVFDSVYGKLPTPSRDGYSFVGWFTESNVSVSRESIVRIPKNHSLYAQWEGVTNQVEIVFEKMDLSDEEIEVFVKEIVADAKFSVVRYEDDKTGEIRVIIEFTDSSEAEEFVRAVRTSDKFGKMVRDVSFRIVREDNSFSAPTYPSTLFGLSML